MAGDIQPTVRVQPGDFDVAAEVSALTAGRADVGAVVSFVGLCRDEAGRLASLELEHYPGMAAAEISRIGAEAIRRWDLAGLTAVHRFGKLLPGERIVLVVAASSHRQAAFQAAEYVMDFMKSRAPFWKREHLRDGSAGDWVESRQADEGALGRWQPS